MLHYLKMSTLRILTVSHYIEIWSFSENTCGGGKLATFSPVIPPPVPVQKTWRVGATCRQLLHVNKLRVVRAGAPRGHLLYVNNLNTEALM